MKTTSLAYVFSTAKMLAFAHLDAPGHRLRHSVAGENGCMYSTRHGLLTSRPDTAQKVELMALA